ncbi:hypothetical protein [Teredinibacter waterburyi]|uniref:hypothetical protein n=1 Tax=Teredinibacter waterburyi TaxID=1500538 RepID=UPI00165FA26D|nr:hypothetical protein [Teredinibacter waterburyi]
MSCPCACCAAGRETPVPRYFFKEHCCTYEEIALFVEFYVVGIRLYIRVLSENPAVLKTLSELATNHAHYFTLSEDDQLHYMEMMARWAFIHAREIATNHATADDSKKVFSDTAS